MSEEIREAPSKADPARVAASADTTATEVFDLSTLPPITRSAVGIAKGLPDRPYKELLVEPLLEKYGNGLSDASARTDAN